MMKVLVQRLEVVSRKSVDSLILTPVTFLHGPVGTGKSTVARLIDYCFGGDLVATPAIQSEFVAARLFATIGVHEVILERDRAATNSVRVTWQETTPDGSTDEPRSESVLAPLSAEPGVPIIPDASDVENLSDLLFHLAGTRPIKVRKSKRDPSTTLVRLSFRDLFFYCYLDQDAMDSSFFALDHPFKRLKSIDAIRFVVGFHSDRMNALEQRLYSTLEQQRAKRDAADQLEQIMTELEFESDLAIAARLQELRDERDGLRQELRRLDEERTAASHPLDEMRTRLRELSAQVGAEQDALVRLEQRLRSRESLRAELLTGKVKALRADAADRVLRQVEFHQCPQCQASVAPIRYGPKLCSLCGQTSPEETEYDVLASEFDERIDELQDLIRRHATEVESQRRRVAGLVEEKTRLDSSLEEEARRYDAAFVARLRELERGIAMRGERVRQLEHLRRIPARLERLVQEAGELQGAIDAARKGIERETERLRAARTVVDDLAAHFKTLLLKVRFPGMEEADTVTVDTRSWEPRVYTKTVDWGFDELGSGGKKVLFKVLYALALHEVAQRYQLPLPTVLIVDSPTKNISHDVNPELFEAFYREVYRVAQSCGADRQFLLIDSELVLPSQEMPDLFSARLLDHSDEAPPLISYYRGH